MTAGTPAEAVPGVGPTIVLDTRPSTTFLASNSIQQEQKKLCSESFGETLSGLNFTLLSKE